MNAEQHKHINVLAHALLIFTIKKGTFSHFLRAVISHSTHSMKVDMTQTYISTDYFSFGYFL